MFRTRRKAGTTQQPHSKRLPFPVTWSTNDPDNFHQQRNQSQHRFAWTPANFTRFSPQVSSFADACLPSPSPPSPLLDPRPAQAPHRYLHLACMAESVHTKPIGPLLLLALVFSLVYDDEVPLRTQQSLEPLQTPGSAFQRSHNCQCCGSQWLDPRSYTTIPETWSHTRPFTGNPPLTQCHNSLQHVPTRRGRSFLSKVSP